MKPALGALLLGATCIALSPIFVRVSEAGPTATAFWRVALAVPPLWLLHALRREAAPPVRAVTSTICAVFLFPLALASGEQMLPSSLLGWGYLLGLALVSHAAGQGLIAYALAHLRAAFSSVSLLFQPVMAALFAWVLLGEALVPLQIAGGIVVLIGIYLARRGSN